MCRNPQLIFAHFHFLLEDTELLTRFMHIVHTQVGGRVRGRGRGKGKGSTGGGGTARGDIGGGDIGGSDVTVCAHIATWCTQIIMSNCNMVNFEIPVGIPLWAAPFRVFM